MHKGRWVLVAALVATLVAAGAAAAMTRNTGSPAGASRSEARTRITMMIGGINKIIYATATLAKQLGYYEKAGVDVYPIDSPAGVEEAERSAAGCGPAWEVVA